MSGKVKNYDHNLWYTEEDGIITIGINEDGLQDITEINSIDLPPEQEKVEAETAFGSLESDDGTIEISSPFEGTIIEVNNQVVDDPEILMEDPYEEGWLVRIEVSEDMDKDDDDEDDDLDDEDEEDDDDDFDDEDEDLDDEDED
ncbi:MAG: glycine cleavage system protein H [Pseudobdellovibrio sp.]